MQINVRVIAGARLNKISEMDSGLKVHITTAPENGKANEAVIKLLSKHFGVPKSRIEIIRGNTVRDKTFLIHD